MIISLFFGCTTKTIEKECEIIKINVIDIENFEFDILYKNSNGYIKHLNTLDKSDMNIFYYKVSENNSYTLIEKKRYFSFWI